MKRLFIICLIATFAVSAQAQEKGGKPAEKPKMDAATRATKLTNKMEKQLLLTAEQKPKVYDINLKAAQKKDEAHAQFGNDKKALGAQRKKIEDERDAELKGVLTAPQYDKWIKMKEEKKKKMKENKGKPKDGGPKDVPNDVEDVDVVDEIESGRG